MRHADQDPTDDAIHHERLLVAAARRHAAQSRARAASASRPDQADLPRLGSPESLTRNRMEPLRDLLPGYALEREIHRGGQGVVYRALQKSTRRMVAIKVMKEGPFAGADDKARFDREVRILAQLDHPSIVAIHDSGTVAGCFYFVMNYIAGSPLDADMGTSQRTMEQTLRLFATICDAVNAAHLRGIVHRDLKPSNIRVDADGRPHVLDFGLARVEEDSAALGASTMHAMTLTGQFVGSLPWASPEQAAGIAGAIDVRTDVYSLGVVMYQLLTGVFPYDVRGTMPEVVHRIVHAEPVRPSAARERRSARRRVFNPRERDAARFRLDDDVDTIVLKCLSKDRDRRYQNAGELARDLRHYLAREPIEARRDSLGYIVRKHVQRHRLAVAFACALLLVLVAGLVVSLAFWREAESARVRLQGALDRADLREKEMRQIADAQAKMLSDVDPQVMGARLHDDILDEARAALVRSGAGEVEVAALLGQLQTLLSGANFTNLGTRSIDRNVLTPALAAIERDYAEQPLVQAALWQSMAKVYDRLGLFSAGVPPAEHAIAARRRELGDTHPDTLDSIQALYWLLQKQGKLADAEPYLHALLDGRRGILADHRRTLGADHPDTLKSMNAVASTLWGAGMFAEAEPYYREAVERSRRVLGVDHPDTLHVMNGFGATLKSLGRLAEAETYVRQTMEGRRRVLGPLDPSTLLAISNMGLFLTSTGRLAEAEPYQREALEGYRQIFGSDHDGTHMRIRNMAVLMEHQGRLAEAETYQREFVVRRQRAKGDDHADTLAANALLAKLLLDQGKYAEAEMLCRRTLETSRRVLGDNHQITLIALGCSGRALAALGNLDEGEALCAQALERSRAARLPDPWLVGVFLTQHAQTLLAMKRYDQAEEELVEAHRVIVAALGPAHPRAAEAIRTLAQFYDAWHAAEPDKEHDATAAQWKARLGTPSEPPDSNP